jgi:hypothetical protein
MVEKKTDGNLSTKPAGPFVEDTIVGSWIQFVPTRQPSLIEFSFLLWAIYEVLTTWTDSEPDMGAFSCLPST